MKLSEIVETVDMLIPNSIPLSTKIQWINQLQNQFFRDYPLPETVHPFAVKANQQFYVLPDDCPQDRITEVVVNDRHYPYIPRVDSETDVERFCTFVSGTLMIYPNPTEQTLGFLYYKPRPVQMTVETMDAEPTFPLDFHELLVFGCASRVAKANPNTLTQANVFDADYRILAEKADLVLRGAKPNRVAITRGWS